jgi:hypothetical protein
VAAFRQVEDILNVYPKELLLDYECKGVDAACMNAACACSLAHSIFRYFPFLRLSVLIFVVFPAWCVAFYINAIKYVLIFQTHTICQDGKIF